MKKLSALMLTLGSIVSISVIHYEARLNLVERDEAGTIQADVERVQSNYSTLVGGEATATEAFKRRVSANMNAIKEHIDAVKCVRGDNNRCKVRADWSY